MKSQINVAVLALLANSANAQSAPNNAHPSPVVPLSYHWNEDPHSVPAPLAGNPYLTSTQARYLANG